MDGTELLRKLQMELTKLQVNDLVKDYDGNIVKVAGIQDEPCLEIRVFDIKANELRLTYGVEGIPITKKLLAKLGFKVHKQDGVKDFVDPNVYVLGNKDTAQSFYDFSDKSLELNTFDEQIILKDVRYIHELQHANRMLKEGVIPITTRFYRELAYDLIDCQKEKLKTKYKV